MTLEYPYGPPLATGVLKMRPQDFCVSETLGFEPDGEGEHLLLWIEKIGLSTPELIERLARACAIKPAHIGYSGLKDKHAVTRQWLSLHLPGKPDPTGLADGDGYRILGRSRHRSKLRPGTHKANHFAVCLREVEGFGAASREQLELIRKQGFANYFGAQRFGRQGDNVQQALARLDHRRLPRTRRSLYLSALRSHLFNQVLSRRIADGYWTRPLDGDVFMLCGSHSIFSAALDADLQRRFAEHDIDSTASLYGSGVERLSGNAAAIERQVFADHAAITECLDRQRVKRQMRALRVLPQAFEFDYAAAEKKLTLELSLPSGSYVTSLLDHCIGT